MENDISAFSQEFIGVKVLKHNIDRYRNIYHVDIDIHTFLSFFDNSIIKILNLNLMILLKFKNLFN